MPVPQHTHQELEDRLTAEMSGMHTELVSLRAETRRGFDIQQALLREQNETLREILVMLGRPDGGDSA